MSIDPNTGEIILNHSPEPPQGDDLLSYIHRKEHTIREAAVRNGHIYLSKEALRECYRREGPNNIKVCKPLALQYLRLLHPTLFGQKQNGDK